MYFNSKSKKSKKLLPLFSPKKIHLLGMENNDQFSEKLLLVIKMIFLFFLGKFSRIEWRKEQIYKSFLWLNLNKLVCILNWMNWIYYKTCNIVLSFGCDGELDDFCLVFLKILKRKILTLHSDITTFRKSPFKQNPALHHCPTKFKIASLKQFLFAMLIHLSNQNW
jgi:hypothetical protein